jgi:hypothetical protein
MSRLQRPVTDVGTLFFWSAFGDKRFEKWFQVWSPGTLLEPAVGMERLLSWLYA